MIGYFINSICKNLDSYTENTRNCMAVGGLEGQGYIIRTNDRSQVFRLFASSTIYLNLTCRQP